MKIKQILESELTHSEKVSQIENHLKGVEKLDLYNSPLHGASIRPLVEVLSTHSTIKKLSVFLTNMQDANPTLLGQILKKNKTLQHLEINAYYVSINDPDETPFNIRSPQATIILAEALAENLKTSTTLTCLQFWHTQINHEGTIALANVLKENTTLKQLIIIDGNIGSQGVQALATALETNTSIDYLLLAENNIESTGTIALAKALTHNTSLNTLRLFLNLIDSDGTQALAQVLKINNTLNTLDLSNVKLNPNDINVLIEALKQNTSLTDLSISDTTKKQCDLIHQLLTKNTPYFIQSQLTKKRLSFDIVNIVSEYLSFPIAKRAEVIYPKPNSNSEFSPNFHPGTVAPTLISGKNIPAVDATPETQATENSTLPLPSEASSMPSSSDDKEPIRYRFHP